MKSKRSGRRLDEVDVNVEEEDEEEEIEEIDEGTRDDFIVYRRNRKLTKKVSKSEETTTQTLTNKNDSSICLLLNKYLRQGREF